MSTNKKIITIIIGIEAVIIAAVIVFLFYINSDTMKVNRQLELAQRYLLEEDYEQAIATFKIIIETDPKNADAYLGLAEAYAATDDLEKAVKTLEKASKRVDSEEVLAMLEIHTAEIEQKELAAQKVAEAAQKAAEAAQAAALAAAQTTASPTGETTPAPQQDTAAIETPASEPEAALRGFIVQDGELYYYDETGNYVTGWFDKNNNRYCARADGRLYRDGEHEINSTKYLFDQGGVCLGETEDEQAVLFAEEDAKLLQSLNTGRLGVLMDTLVHTYVGDGDMNQQNLNALLSGNKEGIRSFFDGAVPAALYVVSYVSENQPENVQELYEQSESGNEYFLTGEQAEYLISSICGKKVNIDFASCARESYIISWIDPYLGIGGAAGDITWNELHDFSVERINANTWKVRANVMYYMDEDWGTYSEFVARVCFTVIKNADSCFDGYSITNAEVELIKG